MLQPEAIMMTHMFSDFREKHMLRLLKFSTYHSHHPELPPHIKDLKENLAKSKEKQRKRERHISWANIFLASMQVSPRLL